MIPPLISNTVTQKKSNLIAICSVCCATTVWPHHNYFSGYAYERMDILTPASKGVILRTLPAMPGLC